MPFSVFTRAGRILQPRTLAFLLVAAAPVFPSAALGADVQLPGLQFRLDGPNGPEQVSTVIEIVFLLTVLSLAPSLLILTTSFTRLAVVLSFMRTALGTQQSPPNQVIVGLALFLTFFIMQPVWHRIQAEALAPYREGEISGEEFLERAAEPMRDFMLKQTRENDLKLFVTLSREKPPENARQLPLATLIPAFVLSELKTAFQIGFLLYIPFIILDMVVSSILLSMGMMMLPPVMISLPFKLMLFVLVDGWNLLVTSLVQSFH
ncbi:flagellar type III secretion system pore protein FliP [Desulfoglaeba alkanexedens]|uniref:Flagellar biosynthetic protein FliP n=1 Tax=Desulfoglaeba alkanexedens ALDC TaxID=980445 RepID=A0A4P8L6H8_9BACT|nr:flagellar type III secretion system pore protein FliP [Desulfoglaeba alkanexedens]QCQ22705.1 flagellar type III secretion system pore protein FliP [Desulfoglaeba alkanexedens ALDC]